MGLMFCEHFTKRAKADPGRVALSDEKGDLSYQEADELSNGLAKALVQDGLKAGEAVAVFVSRQKEIMLGAISILKAGGIYMPLDEGYPDERLLYMLENGDVRFILADRTLWESRQVSLGERKVYFFDEAEGTADFNAVPRNMDDPSMILYTSGTTGNPKGVIHRQALLAGVNDWLAGNEGLDLTPESHLGIMSGFTFVATNVFMFGVLFGGGTLHIAPADVKLSTDILYQYIKDNGITHIFMPSSLTAAMAEEYDMGGIAIFSGGEKLRNFTPLSPETEVYNMYGSTELATIFSNRVYGNETVMPIGYLTKGSEALLVDENLKEVKEGETGEALICDPRMSHGYLKLPEQTAQKWITIDGKLYFRTGDRMKRDAKGRYFILGRIDNMVKLRGFRIETGEVETQVSKAMVGLRLPAVQVAVVLKNVNGIDHLACYYESAEVFDSKKIISEIENFLPHYMIPDLWTAVEKMPRNANGKVMRKDLPEPDMPIHLLGAIFSEAELRVVQSTGYVLKLEGAIDPDESFVELGGDSLRAMELSSVLDEQGIKISGTKILSSESLRDIAKDADIKYERFWSVDEYEAVKATYLEHGEKIEKVLPLAPSQDDLICLTLTHPDRLLSRKRFMFVFESILQEKHLRHVLDVLADRHEEMRASVVIHDVTVFQSVITDRKIPLKMIRSYGKDLASVYKALNNEDSQKTFDLQFSPLFQVICVDRGDDPSWLFVMVNKIAYDENVIRHLFTEMMELLLEFYPVDKEMRSWTELFREASEVDSDDESDRIRPQMAVPGKNEQKEICIYSDKPKKKIFFVHTGNTGSAAYYQLAQRIKEDYAFAVIEPYNLYHMDDADYGIDHIAKRYIEIMKKYQPQGPYILGGWCYGGVVAHEMACQLEEAGEEVSHLIMLDAHALANPELVKLASPMQAMANRSYFETSPLFKELRENGMLEAVVSNAAHVTADLNTHVPKMYHGDVTYFKPEHTPAAANGEVLKYWQEMMKKQAGNYENYCEKDKLEVIVTPREHDEMMEEDALDIIVPKIYEVLG